MSRHIGKKKLIADSTVTILSAAANEACSLNKSNEHASSFCLVQ